MTTNVRVQDLDLPPRAGPDNRRLEVVADLLPLFHGAQLTIDTTVVSPVRRDGSPRRQCATKDGAHGKSAPVPNLPRLTEERVWWWWWLTFLHLLADAKVRDESEDFREAIKSAWMRRWKTLLACAAARAFALSLLERRCAPGFDGVAPSSADVVRDHGTRCSSPFFWHASRRARSLTSLPKKWESGRRTSRTHSTRGSEPQTTGTFLVGLRWFLLNVRKSKQGLQTSSMTSDHFSRCCAPRDSVLLCELAMEFAQAEIPQAIVVSVRMKSGGIRGTMVGDFALSGGSHDSPQFGFRVLDREPKSKVAEVEQMVFVLYLLFLFFLGFYVFFFIFVFFCFCPQTLRPQPSLELKILSVEP